MYSQPKRNPVVQMKKPKKYALKAPSRVPLSLPILADAYVVSQRTGVCSVEGVRGIVGVISLEMRVSAEGCERRTKSLRVLEEGWNEILERSGLVRAAGKGTRHKRVSQHHMASYTNSTHAMTYHAHAIRRSLAVPSGSSPKQLKEEVWTKSGGCTQRCAGKYARVSNALSTSVNPWDVGKCRMVAAMYRCTSAWHVASDHKGAILTLSFFVWACLLWRAAAGMWHDVDIIKG